MRKSSCVQRFSPAIVAILMLVSTIAVASMAEEGVEGSSFIPGELIVQVSSAKGAADLAADFASVNMQAKKVLSRRMNIWLHAYSTAGLKSAAEHEEVLAQVRRHPAVEIGQFNHTMTLRTTFPNDPSFSQQWALHNTGQTGGVVDADIDGPEAWDLTTSGMTAGGDQIVVAIVDGGCDINHPDISFFKNTDEIPGNGIDDDGNGYIDDYDGWDAYASDGSVPGNDHGTHVAGIAAAIGNNGAGVSGVNWGVKVMPIAGSSTSEATVVEAYGYALEMRARYNESDGLYGAFVVATNSSFGVDYGNPANYPIWCAFYDSLGAYGVLSAAATANIGMDIDVNGDVPTACPSDYMIAVTNTTSSDVRNSGAGYGTTTIDLGAPGTSVYSTLQGGGYGNKTGTSMATPHVAGAVGFMYSAALPGLIELARQRPDSVALLIKQAILDGTDPIASLTGVTVTGGRLNLHNAAVLVQAIPTGVSIVHTPLKDTRDTLNDYAVSAQITSDTTLVADSLRLHYEIASVWTSVVLSPGLGVNEYIGNIPAQGPGTEIQYYLTAADEEGKADTTDTFGFRVVDYVLEVNPARLTQTGLVTDTLWYDYRVVNAGLRADDYSLGIMQSKWVTEIFDSALAGPIATTGMVAAEDSVSVKVRVIIPASSYLSADTAVMVATSTANPALSDTGIAVTTSDGPALLIPFADEFPVTQFDSAKWARVVQAEISTQGIGEPSPVYSVNLDGHPYGADTLLSMAIDLRAESNIIVSYAYERTGGGDSPEAGDDLFVEYFDSSGVWRLIAQHLGADADMTAFEEVKYVLPAEAFHRRFRLRLRSIGTPGVFDDWFVDDVFVGHPPPYAVTVLPPASRQYGLAGDTVHYELKILNRGTNTDRYNLYPENLGGWAVSVYDSTGLAPLARTPLLPGGDSVRIVAKVAIPAGAGSNEESASRVRVVSVNNPYVTDTAALETVSSGPPGGFPWFEDFPEDSLITLRWPSNAGATVSTEAVDPPSPPYVLDLDGDIDTVISQVIDLAGVSEAILTYHYQRGMSDPPDAGEDLWVEYKTSTGQWVLIDQLPGGGGGMNWFARRVLPLAPAALHSGFQLRLRSLGSCTGCDHWYLDDIRVDYAPDIAVEPGSIAAELEQGDSATAPLIVRNEGLGGLDWSINRIPTTAGAPFARLFAEEALEPAIRTYPDGFEDYEDPKGGDDPRSGVPVLRDAGGPDAYGYYWIDSDEAAGPEFAWIDATAEGINIVGNLTDDSFDGPYAIGFDFPFYDSTYSTIFVGSNGLVGFSPTNLSSRFKRRLPNDTTPNAILAWLWDDLNPTDGANPGAAVYVDATPERCVIQFVDYPEYLASAGDVVNAEVILYPDGSIVFQYLAVAAGFDVASCAVGIESPDGTDGLEVAYLTPYLKDSLAILFRNPSQWLTLDRTFGTLAPGEADTLAVKIYTASLDSGVFGVNMIVSSNDPDENPWVIPAMVTVTIPPQYVCGDVSGDGGDPTVGDLTFLISFLFRGGPPPPVMEAADADGSGGSLTISDLTYFIAYLFRGGPAPICGG